MQDFQTEILYMLNKFTLTHSKYGSGDHNECQFPMVTTTVGHLNIVSVYLVCRIIMAFKTRIPINLSASLKVHPLKMIAHYGNLEFVFYSQITSLH